MDGGGQEVTDMVTGTDMAEGTGMGIGAAITGVMLRVIGEV
jgi:hypothetical protein